MSTEQRLNQRYSVLQQLWETANNLLRHLRQKELLETRAEEEYRLRLLIEQKTHEQEQLEQQLQALETRLNNLSQSSANPQPTPQQASTARLAFKSGSKVQQSRLFATHPVTLGRPMAEQADLWLTLLPLDNPDHHPIMDRMSRTHAIIGWDQQPRIKDGGSRNFTFVNGASLNADWRILEDGDEIAFQRSKALVFRACVESNQWLCLDRVNNGEDIENYLLLNGHISIDTLSKKSDSESLNAELSHDQGGFVLSIWSDVVTVNDDSASNGTLIGLNDGDHIVAADLEFHFHVGAYSD